MHYHTLHHYFNTAADAVELRLLPHCAEDALSQLETAQPVAITNTEQSISTYPSLSNKSPLNNRTSNHNAHQPIEQHPLMATFWSKSDTLLHCTPLAIKQCPTSTNNQARQTNTTRHYAQNTDDNPQTATVNTKIDTHRETHRRSPPINPPSRSPTHFYNRIRISIYSSTHSSLPRCSVFQPCVCRPWTSLLFVDH